MPYKEVLPTHTLSSTSPNAWTSYGQATIAVPAAKVWRILTDVSSYPQWNSLMPRLTLDDSQGFIKEGGRGTLYTKPTANFEGHNKQTIRFQVVTENERLLWNMSPEDPALLEEWVHQLKAGPDAASSTTLETWITLAGPQAPDLAAADGKTLDDWMPLFLDDVKKRAEQHAVL